MLRSLLPEEIFKCIYVISLFLRYPKFRIVTAHSTDTNSAMKQKKIYDIRVVKGLTCNHYPLCVKKCLAHISKAG